MVEGKFVLLKGVPADLHFAARKAAFDAGITFKAWMLQAVAEKLGQTAAPEPTPAADATH